MSKTARKAKAMCDTCSFVYDKKFIWLLFLSFLFIVFVYLFGINKFLAPIFLLVILFILYKTFLKFNSFKW